MSTTPEPVPQLLEAKPAKQTLAPARGFVRFLYCSNPFYVISAGLILWGLYQSFDTAGDVVETLSLMSSLWGYTLLLAAAAVFLIRWGRVWDDVRTVLLLIVLMFLAGSVTFDRLLVSAEFELGRSYAAIGLGLSMLISEIVLGGTRLRLPMGFRLPYYLILALFFLYPIHLAPYAQHTKHPATSWLLLAFPTLAAGAFLTLLPAVRLGRSYVRDNGSPWKWPLYPYTLFGVLAFCVVARAYMLCVTFHPILGETTIFAPYFLAPFLFALAILGLEMSRVEKKAWLGELTMAATVLVIAISAVGLQSVGLQRRFVEEFVTRVGMTPFYAALLLAIAFYGYTLLRKFPGASPMLTVVLATIVFWGPNTRMIEGIDALHGSPMIVLGLLQLIRSERTKSSARGIISCCLIIGGCCLAFPGPELLAYRGAIPLHLLLFAMLVFAISYTDPTSRFLRAVSVGYLFTLGAITAIAPASLLGSPPGLWLFVHPPLMVALALTTFLMLREAAFLRAAWLLLALWAGMQGAPEYLVARGRFLGLDWILGGAAFFLLAFYISLRKANLVPHWLVLAMWGKPLTKEREAVETR